MQNAARDEYVSVGFTFGDAVYEAAVETAGWPADLIGPRCDGWRMSTTPPAAVRGRDQ
jgi:hypothetical protein